MLSTTTPIILTYNEAPNIGRTLARLSWAADVVVVDSNSDDETLEIARQYPNVRVFTRPFHSHADQWNFAISETDVRTDWILALDADYLLTDEFVEELRQLRAPPEVCGYSTRFEYCVQGKPLRASLYPPVITLFRRGCGRYVQDGHTQRLQLEGAARHLTRPILHDDRKALSRWIASQAHYCRLEARKLASAAPGSLSAPDVIRKWIVVAPALVFPYVLFAKGAILDGRAGLFYAVQRAVAELLLSLYILQERLDREGRRE